MSPLPAPRELGARALDNLRYIRETMERSSTFTAVPGLGGMAMGATALLAALVSSRAETNAAWLRIWLADAAVAAAIGAWALHRKASRAGISLLGAPARRFLLALAAPLASGALLTAALVRAGQWHLLAPVWLLLYGSAAVAGGVLSVRAVPLMGAGFLLLGTAALLSSPSRGTAYLAGGFGGLEIVFGAWIWRRHGG